MSNVTFINSARSPENHFNIRLREPPLLPPTGSDGQRVSMTHFPLTRDKQRSVKHGLSRSKT